MVFHMIHPERPDGHEHGRPASRLEVQQQLLRHQRRQYVDVAERQPLRPRLGRSVLSFRRSLGHMLIGLGGWMSRESADSATGKDLAASR